MTLHPQSDDRPSPSSGSRNETEKTVVGYLPNSQDYSHLQIRGEVDPTGSKKDTTNRRRHLVNNRFSKDRPIWRGTGPETDLSLPKTTPRKADKQIQVTTNVPRLKKSRFRSSVLRFFF